jgi:hypothetical protein
MNILFCSMVLFVLLGANSDGASFSDSALLQGDFQNSTYECSAYDCSTCDDSCGDTCEESCGTTCGRGICRDRTACGPLSFVFSIFNANTWRGPTCGERYWGDFYSDPPACHDPCDRCGNYVGRSTYGSDWGSVRGYSSGSIGGGCNCNKNRVMSDEPIMEEGRVTHPTTRVSRQPTPARQPSKAVRIQ